jgi:hypothetical protein
MPYNPNYPASVAEVIDDSMTFRPSTLEAVRNFKASYPWRGSTDERKAKFERLHEALCGIYGKQTTLTFGQLDGQSSGSSSYCPSTDTITITGKLSVVTYLHEWGHALGKDERQACKWSLNLFKRVFPRLFARSQRQGHMIISPAHPSPPPEPEQNQPPDSQQRKRGRLRNNASCHNGYIIESHIESRMGANTISRPLISPKRDVLRASDLQISQTSYQNGTAPTVNPRFHRLSLPGNPKPARHRAVDNRRQRHFWRVVREAF